MRDSDDDSFDPAMDCIIALEEQRLGRLLTSREADDLVSRFFRPRNAGEYSSLHSQDSPQKTSKPLKI
jgi:hypothetical protein